MAEAIHWSLNVNRSSGSANTLFRYHCRQRSQATVKKNVRELTDEMPLIQQQMKAQSLRLQHVGKTFQDTILVVNTHTNLFNRTLLSVGKLVEVMNYDYAHVQLVVGDKWLVNTPFTSATMTYDRHGSITQLAIPNQTVFVSVPECAIVHIDDLALYHLHGDRQDTEIEIPDAFAKRTLELAPTIQDQILYEGPMVVDLSLLDDGLVIKPADYKPKEWSVARSWTITDSILTTTIILGFIALG
ncbi:unnamed protein product, partial [Coregonus sp. 'balchen']